MINPRSETVKFAKRSAVGDPIERNFRYIIKTAILSPKANIPDEKRGGLLISGEVTKYQNILLLLSSPGLTRYDEKYSY